MFKSIWNNFQHFNKFYAIVCLCRRSEKNFKLVNHPEEKNNWKNFTRCCRFYFLLDCVRCPFSFPYFPFVSYFCSCCQHIRTKNDPFAWILFQQQNTQKITHSGKQDARRYWGGDEDIRWCLIPFGASPTFCFCKIIFSVYQPNTADYICQLITQIRWCIKSMNVKHDESLYVEHVKQKEYWNKGTSITWSF